MRINQQLVEKYKALQAKKLGRDEESILLKGLKAGDFKAGQKVKIKVPGELDCSFYNAFSVIDESIARVAVFTEHCGYHEFYIHGAKIIESVSDEF